MRVLKVKNTVCFSLFSTLYPSLGLCWKLADLGRLHSLGEEGVCPTGTGGVSVGLLGSNRKIQTFLGSESTLPRPEIRSEINIKTRVLVVMQSISMDLGQ